MKDQKWLLLSHSLIGTGFFFLYIQHVRSIYESRTNIAYLTQLERESLLREDALYYSFYKTITDEPDFWSGYYKLKNLSGIEYPNNVNVIKSFHVLPEVFIGSLYHLIKRYNTWSIIPFFTCWRSNDIHLPPEHRRCDSHGQAMQFYLEFVWLLGGLTILIIYMYATLLSENVFGGIYAVLSYVMFHSYAAKIYERPLARENFAFPILLMQMFYLCLSMDRVTIRKEHTSRIVVGLMLTFLTTISLLCWQFSSVIFATQLVIMMLPWSLTNVPVSASSIFTADYALTQLLAITFAFNISDGNKKYLFSWQIGPAISLVLISIIRSLKPQTLNNDFSLKTISISILMAFNLQGTITDMLEKTGLARPLDNSFAFYQGLLVRWIFQQKVNFGISLAACNPLYERMEFIELWDLIKTLAVRPYCMYGVVMLARFFRKWRKSGEIKKPDADGIERAKKYLLEVFLEDNHITMKDISNKDTEKCLQACLKELEKCDYDYERYCREKKVVKNKRDEHKEFLNDINKLKEEIHEVNEKKNKLKEIQLRNLNCELNAINDTVNADKDDANDLISADIDHNDDSNDESNKHNNIDEDKRTDKSVINEQNEANTKAKIQAVNCIRKPSKTHEKNIKTKTKSEKNDNSNKNINDKVDGKATKSSSSSSNTFGWKNEFLTFHSIYSFIQLAVLTFLGLNIRKLFFMCFTMACIIAPTVSCKFWYRKQRNFFWTISLTVFVTSFVHPGMMNIHDEYFPTRHQRSEDLDSMLEWIKMNTEKDAVFAGPIDVIGTVHLTTRRPIVNHAHLEMNHMSDRTEHIYSVFSRQPSSDIYTQCAQLKIQYMIISLDDCVNDISECDILSIWDVIQPAYRKFPQFCWELNNGSVPSFFKVYANEHYSIIKMFSQSVQINLKYTKMPEKSM